MFKDLININFSSSEHKDMIKALSTIYTQAFGLTQEDAEILVEKKLNYFKDDFVNKFENAVTSKQINDNVKFEDISTEEYLNSKPIIKG